MSPRRGVAQPKTPVVPLLPMTNGVVLPGMVVSVRLETATARSAVAAAKAAASTLLLVPTIDGRPAEIGTLATVEEAGRLRTGADVLVVRGIQRARLGTKVADTEDVVWVQVEPVDDPAPSSSRVCAGRSPTRIWCTSSTVTGTPSIDMDAATASASRSRRRRPAQVLGTGPR